MADGGADTPDSEQSNEQFTIEQLSIAVDELEGILGVRKLSKSSNSDSTPSSQTHSRTHSEGSIASSSSSRQSRNRFLFPKIDTVEELRPEQVRWFYKHESDKKWIPFIGYDSLRIECQYREVCTRSDPEDVVDKRSDLIVTRGGLYEVDVVEKKCIPVYWNRKSKCYIHILYALHIILITSHNKILDFTFTLSLLYMTHFFKFYISHSDQTMTF